jgi:hypothetical protein
MNIGRALDTTVHSTGCHGNNNSKSQTILVITFSGLTLGIVIAMTTGRMHSCIQCSANVHLSICASAGVRGAV